MKPTLVPGDWKDSMEGAATVVKSRAVDARREKISYATEILLMVGVAVLIAMMLLLMAGMLYDMVKPKVDDPKSLANVALNVSSEIRAMRMALVNITGEARNLASMLN